MDFFDRLSEIISTTGKDVSNKAKGFTEIVKLNSQISSEEAKRRESYTLLGKMYYDTIKDNPPEDFAEIAAIIEKTFEDEHELRERLRILKGMAKCTGCGRDIPIENAYCSFCGTKNESKPAEEPVQECCCGCAEPEDTSECCCSCEEEKTECTCSCDCEEETKTDAE